MSEMESLFSDEEIETLETDEARLKRIANEIFRAWYVKWYEDEEGRPRYSQSKSHIAKEIKDAIFKGLDPFQVEWAANILGQEFKPINALNLQWSLARVRKVLDEEARAFTSGNDNGGSQWV